MAIIRYAQGLLIAGALALAAPSPASFAQNAPSAEALQTAHQLVDLTTKDIVGQVAQTMAAQIWPLVERGINPRPDAATLDKLKSEFQAITADVVRDGMKDMPAIYARYFTADELKTFVTFYSSGPGQKFLKTQPQLMQEMAALIGSKQGEINTMIMERIGPILRNAQQKN